MITKIVWFMILIVHLYYSMSIAQTKAESDTTEVTPRPELSQKIYKKVAPTVVKIELDNANKIGSGVIIGITDIGRGVILTACHVIATNYESVQIDSLLTLTFHDDIRIKLAADTTEARDCEFLNYFDRKNDLALILTKSAIPEDRIIRYALSQDTGEGRIVAAMGFPDSDILSETVGNVKRIDGGYLIFDAEIAPGSSGGPLIDKHGRMVGLSQFTYEDEGFSAPIDSIRTLVDPWLVEMKVKRIWQRQRFGTFWERMVKDPLIIAGEIILLGGAGVMIGIAANPPEPDLPGAPPLPGN